MCFEFELEYQQRRAEEARRELQRLEEERRAREQEQPKPARDVEPAPV
jgi:hypothetical protein